MTRSTASEPHPIRNRSRALDSGTGPTWRGMPRRHVFMLALAAEVLVMGWRWSERYRPPGITVEVTITEGHEIT